VVLSLALTLAGVPFLVAALYLLMLAVASLRKPGPPPTEAACQRLVVIVPAHDEAELVGRCVDSLRRQDYPAELFRVVVVADNCSDGTAEQAHRAGAEVMERRDQAARGKGQALRWAMDRVLAAAEPPDGIAVVDADSVADRGLLAGLAEQLAAGRPAVQGEYLVLGEDESARSRLVEAAFLLFHRVRLGGRAALGLPVNLVGNGMLLSRDLLSALPWDAFSGVEDLEYSIRLRLAGVHPAYAPRALVRGPIPRGYSAMQGQRLRWEGGRFHVLRARLPELASRGLRGDAGALDAAVDLAVPPLGLLVMALLAGGAVSAGLVALGTAAAASLLPWVLALLCLAGFVLVGLHSAGAPASTYLAMLEVPRFLLWKLLTYLRLARGFDPSRWERAQREPGGGLSATGSPADRVLIGGVPVDRVGMSGALMLLRNALEERRQVQVATVNVDFLVGAQRSPELRAVLASSEVNVADGTPVVWLSRLLGRPVPERVAGTDLVPAIAAEAARGGFAVFLLGGEGGVAGIAARRLAREHEGIRIAGWLEPPRAPLEALDSESMVAAVNEAQPDVLLVALGNPKQELWIAQHRHLLPSVSVLIGVGCVFDLMAGRARRAPRWMQRSGLEWLHRLAGEPRRLARRYVNDGAWLLLASTRILVRRAQLGPPPARGGR
jgi:1,2-diacylglycerol 3-beta-glucosyltransferase